MRRRHEVCRALGPLTVRERDPARKGITELSAGGGFAAPGQHRLCGNLGLPGLFGGICLSDLGPAQFLLDHGLQLSPRLAFPLVSHTGPASAGLLPGAPFACTFHGAYVPYGADGIDVIRTLAIVAGHSGFLAHPSVVSAPPGRRSASLVHRVGPRRENLTIGPTCSQRTTLKRMLSKSKMSHGVRAVLAMPQPQANTRPPLAIRSTLGASTTTGTPGTPGAPGALVR